jgi:hypothetical protein
VAPGKGLNLDAVLIASPASPAPCGTHPTVSVKVTGVPPSLPDPVGSLLTQVQFNAYRIRTVNPPQPAGERGFAPKQSWLWTPLSAGFFKLEATVKVVSRQAPNQPLAQDPHYRHLCGEPRVDAQSNSRFREGRRSGHDHSRTDVSHARCANLV